MFKKTLALSAAGLLLVCSAFAMPVQSKKQSPKPKLIVLNTCPIMGGAASEAKGGSSVVGKYQVTFCCGGCKPQFDKLAKAEKDKKVAEIVKKAGKKTASLKEINTCPIMGGDSTGGKGGSSVVGTYKVNFCCGGCKPAFDKMSAADKATKLAELAKKG